MNPPNPPRFLLVTEPAWLIQRSFKPRGVLHISLGGEVRPDTHQDALLSFGQGPMGTVVANYIIVCFSGPKIKIIELLFKLAGTAIFHLQIKASSSITEQRLGKYDV